MKRYSPTPTSAPEPKKASTTRSSSPIQPRRTAIATKNTIPRRTARPPTQARSRPPKSSSKSMSRLTARCRAAGGAAGSGLPAGTGGTTDRAAGAGVDASSSATRRSSRSSAAAICPNRSSAALSMAERWHVGADAAENLPRVAAYAVPARDHRALRRNGCAGRRPPRRLPRLVRDRTRRVPQKVRRRLPGSTGHRRRGHDLRGPRPLPPARRFRRPARDPHPVYRDARCPLQVRVHSRAERRARRRRLDGTCLRRRQDHAAYPRARLVSRGDYAGGGGGGSFGGGGGGSFGGGSLGGGGSGRSFVPYWTTVGSDR